MEVWIGRNGERLGPYREEDIRQWLRDGSLRPEELGWYEGLADWQPMRILFPDEAHVAPPMPPLPSMAPTYAPTESLPEYAGFWIRAAAWAIDYIILLIPSTVVAMSMGVITAMQQLLVQMQAGGDTMQAMEAYATIARPASLFILALGFIYYAAFEASPWQGTPGKRLLGLRVTDLAGQRIGMARSLGRNAVRLTNAVIFIIPLVCYLAVAWTQRKQGLHDMLASTLVVTGKTAAVAPVTVAPRNDGGSFTA